MQFSTIPPILTSLLLDIHWKCFLTRGYLQDVEKRLGVIPIKIIKSVGMLILTKVTSKGVELVIQATFERCYN